ncbi:MAG: response regulator transcription factor [Ilumatobacteraceae bacterium]
MISIVLADDHSLIRTSLTRMLSTQPDFEVVGVATDGQQAVELVREFSPDVVLMDLHMPVVDGVSAIAVVTRDHPGVAVIALSAFEEPTQVTAALAAGAQGYLIKDTEPEVLFAGIRAAATGGVPLSPRIAAQIIRKATTANSQDALTDREVQVLHMIVDGRSNAQIGEALNVSRATVTAVCGRLFRRLKVADRTQAAVWAMKNLPPLS